MRDFCFACGRAAYRQLIVGAGCFIEREGALLLLRRTTQPFEGRWNLPAGHVDFDEDPQGAAVREAKEETGLEVEAQKLAGAYYSTDHPAGNGVFLVWHCKVIGGWLRSQG